MWYTQGMQIYTRDQWAVLSSELRGECEEWQGRITTEGYGRNTRAGKPTRLAHRIAWLEQVGPIPSVTPCVLHHCDNRLCVRVSHLFLGTKTDNSADMVAKGRHARGSSNSDAKLSEADVLDIRRRAASERQVSLAIEYGVSASNISNIIARRIWKHI